MSMVSYCERIYSHACIPKTIPAHLRQIITSLYALISQSHSHAGTPTEAAMTAEIKLLIKNLVLLSRSARRLPVRIPLDIIQYVESTRNPDIYTREFVELVMKNNQMMKGRSEAFARFRDILGREMGSAIPEISGEVREIVEAGGGKVGQ